MTLRLVFAGTPDFAVPTLQAAIASGHDVLAVYTQPDRPAGRGRQLAASPVKQLAQQHGIEVRQPETLRDIDAQTALRALEPDLMIVVAYGLILPQAVLDIPTHGAWNVHASLLPRWRGAAPIQRAIMAGDSETGMMVMKMDKGLDTGPVALTRRVAIGDTMTAGELHDRLMQAGGTLMAEAMAKLAAGDLPLTPQAEEGVLYASKIDKAETRIDFSRPARDVHNHIRGLSPVPGAWFELSIAGKPERVKVLASEQAAGTTAEPAGTVLDDRLAVASGDGGAVRLVRLQKAGGKPLDAADFLRGTPVAPGQVLA